MAKMGPSKTKMPSMRNMSIASAMSVFEWAEEDSEWMDSSELSLPESWDYKGDVKGSIFVTAKTIVHEEFDVDEAMGKIKKFYAMHDGCEFDHPKLYKVYQETFDRHAQGLMYAFGTSITDMQDPNQRKKFNHDGMYFEIYRPHASLRRIVRLISIEAVPENPGIFVFVTEEEFAGRTVTTSFCCLAKHGKVFRIQHEEQWQDCRTSPDMDHDDEEPNEKEIQQDAASVSAAKEVNNQNGSSSTPIKTDKKTSVTSTSIAKEAGMGDASRKTDKKTNGASTSVEGSSTTGKKRQRRPLVLVNKIKERLKKFAFHPKNV